MQERVQGKTLPEDQEEESVQEKTVQEWSQVCAKGEERLQASPDLKSSHQRL